MNFYSTAYGRHKCLFCGTQNDLALFEVDFDRGEIPSMEELTSLFGPNFAIVAETVGAKVIVCSCRKHIRYISSLDNTGDEMAKIILGRAKQSVKDEDNTLSTPTVPSDYIF